MRTHDFNRYLGCWIVSAVVVGGFTFIPFVLWIYSHWGNK